MKPAGAGLYKSKTGLVLAGCYLVAIALAYEDYRRHPAQWLADLLLVLLTLPFTLAGRVLSGSSRFEVSGDDPWTLIPAILVCTALAYVIGAGLGALTNWIRARLR